MIAEGEEKKMSRGGNMIQYYLTRAKYHSSLVFSAKHKKGRSIFFPSIFLSLHAIPQAKSHFDSLSFFVIISGFGGEACRSKAGTYGEYRVVRKTDSDGKKLVVAIGEDARLTCKTMLLGRNVYGSHLAMA
ncbi:Uncharacterized protein FKW44_004351 [Caligus rogercresseyi]|uniref:Uncharacterized protein n=1 Tax=Caligus rogercresseyi TaxID=217165 RepID=A0A7T8KBA7_CALRO|nr:Uncharacterized protein FKW44_004351 [Caligus rogercresseyi]